MGADNSWMTGNTSFDHDVTRVVLCDPEILRARLADAVERMGYRVLNENPVQSRRGASGLAKSGCAADILEYRRSLDIGMKSVGGNATRVTFAYTVNGVNSGQITKGDRSVLTREAEAILALAQNRSALSYCPACGADSAGGTRFCRQCGTPLASIDPPELELMRLTAVANASYKKIAWGVSSILIGALASTIFILKFFLSPDHSDAKLLKLVLPFLGGFGAAGLALIIAGLWRLGRSIKQRPEHEETWSPSRRAVAEGAVASDTSALPPPSVQQPIRHSVAEATTGLLPQEVKNTNDLS